MPDPMRIRATAQGDAVDVRVLMAHEMAGGNNPHYIQTVNVTHNGKVVLSAEWGPAVSKNPYLQFKFAGGKKGDELMVTWVDNKGETRTDKTTIN
jgi:sulfur-oxidizing protein SoxZ